MRARTAGRTLRSPSGATTAGPLRESSRCSRVRGAVGSRTMTVEGAAEGAEATLTWLEEQEI